MTEEKRAEGLCMLLLATQQKLCEIEEENRNLQNVIRRCKQEIVLTKEASVATYKANLKSRIAEAKAIYSSTGAEEKVETLKAVEFLIDER